MATLLVVTIAQIFETESRIKVYVMSLQQVIHGGITTGAKMRQTMETFARPATLRLEILISVAAVVVCEMLLPAALMMPAALQHFLPAMSFHEVEGAVTGLREAAAEVATTRIGLASVAEAAHLDPTDHLGTASPHVMIAQKTDSILPGLTDETRMLLIAKNVHERRFVIDGSLQSILPHIVAQTRRLDPPHRL